MGKRLTASMLVICAITACGSTSSGSAGKADQAADGASSDTYITADQSNGVNARSVVPASGASGRDIGDGTFIAP